MRSALWIITEEAESCAAEDIGLVLEIGLANYSRRECAAEADFMAGPSSDEEKWLSLDDVGAVWVLSEAYVERDLVKVFVLSATEEPQLHCRWSNQVDVGVQSVRAHVQFVQTARINKYDTLLLQIYSP